MPPVETVMRHVDFHVDSSLVMRIEYLRGRLAARRAGQPASFDDPLSFEIEMDTAAITLSTNALADLLNRYVFNYPGTPLRGLELSIDRGRLKQKGRLHGFHFSLVSEIAVTGAGEFRLHPVSIHVLGIGAGGLMKLFGLSLHKLADVRKAPGVRIEKNDLFLTPAVMLPPPSTRGKLVAVTLRDSSVTLKFGARARTTSRAARPARDELHVFQRRHHPLLDAHDDACGLARRGPRPARRVRLLARAVQAAAAGRRNPQHGGGGA